MTTASISAPLPPVVPGLPIIGCALQTAGDPRDFLMAQFRKFGPVFRIKALHIDYVVMAGPSANQFCNAEGRDFFQSNTFWKGMMHELEADNFLIGLDGEDHTALRKIFKNDFSKAALEPHVETISKLCLEMFQDLPEGEEFQVVERVLQLTSQMIGCVMSGQVPSREELKNFLYYINDITNHFNLQRLPSWALWFKPKRFKEARKMTLNFAEQVISQHITGKDGLHNFVDSVMEAADKCPHLFEHGDVRFSAILPLFAGIDTLGQTINYALFELHRHPHLLKEVQEEIDAVFSEGIPDTKRLKEMDRLNAAIMETLRLHPSAFGMVRTANRDFEFEGHKVSKGQDVVILTTASHKMNEYFPEPNAFDPHRFMEPRNEHRQRNVLAPFGRGPHTCLGAGLSEVMLALSIGSILYHYEFEPLDPNQKYQERISPTPSLGRQFKLTLKRKRQK